MPAGGSQGVRAGRAYVEIGATDKNLMAGLNKAAARVKAFAASVARVGEGMKSAGTTMARYGAMVAVPLGFASRAAADFETQMAQVSTMVDEPAKHMGRFSDGVQSMSKEFGESTEALAGGLYDILSASVAPEQALDVLRVATMAAKAGLTDTKTAGDALTTMLNSYGLAADQAASMSDLLFAVVKRGKTTFAELAPQMGMVASTAASAGVRVEELGAMIATLTRNGVRTENAITATNQVIMQFLKPAEESKSAAEALGFEMSAATLKAEGLEGVFKRMAKLDANQIAEIFPDARALRGAIPALKDVAGFGQDLAVMRNRAGLSGAAFAKFSGTAETGFNRLKQSVVAVGVAIGDAVNERLKTYGSSLNYAAGVVERFAKHNAGLVTIVAALAVGAIAAGAALYVIGTIVTAVAGGLAAMMAVAAAIGPVLAAVFSPVGLAVAAAAIAIPLAAVGAVLAAMAVHAAVVGGIFEQLFGTQARAASVQFNDGLSQTGTLIGWLGDLATWYAGVVVRAFPAVLTEIGALGRAWAGLRDDFGKAWGGITDALAAGDLALAGRIAMATLRLAWARGVNLLLETWNVLREGTADSFARIFKGVLGLWETARTTLVSSFITLGHAMARAIADPISKVMAKVAEVKWLATQVAIQAANQAGLLSGEAARAAMQKADAARQSDLAFAGAVGQILPGFADQAALLLGGAEAARHAARLKQIDEEAAALKAKVGGAIPGAGTSVIQAEIDRLRRERDALVKTAAAEAAAANAGAAPPTVPTPPDAPKLPESPAAAVDGAVKKIDSAGTFSAAGAALLGGAPGRHAERTAKATESTVKKLDKIIEQGEWRKRNPLVFQ